jgi:alpha-L-fucosidase
VAKAIVDEGTWKRVRRYAIEAQEGETWKTIVTGKEIGAERSISFPTPVKGRVFRLHILDASEGPTIHEFSLFR